jgi:hypothetical protein
MKPGVEFKVDGARIAVIDTDAAAVTYRILAHFGKPR